MDGLASILRYLRQTEINRPTAIFVSPDTLYVVTMKSNCTPYYKCGKEFHLGLLEQDLSENDLIGLISIDNTECGFGILKGDNLQVLKTITSGVNGKTRKGGQSSRRYERLRDMHLNDYYNRVAEYARRYFLDTLQVKELCLGGPAFTKHVFADNGYLEYRLQNKITRYTDGCYSGEDGLYEMRNQLL